MITFGKNIIARTIVPSLFFILLAIIIYKSIVVPITHDEKSATVYYPTFTVWEIMKYPDCWPSNHILNSIIIKFEERAFGISPVAVRLHSILAFVFFFVIVFFIAKKYFSKSGILFCLPFFIMFCNPFLLDFFGLARGYGLSNALMAASLCSLLFYASSEIRKYYWLSIVFSMLAAYANFTLLIYWAALNVLLGAIVLFKPDNNKITIQQKLIQLALTGLLAIGFIALCYGPLYKMQSTNQFVYWSKESFFKDTIINQVDEFRYGNSWLMLTTKTVARIVTGIFIFSLFYCAFKFLKGMRIALADPLVILTLLLFIVYAVNMFQAIALGTPYLSTRTALSYYVIFAFVFMFLMRDVGAFFTKQQSDIVFSIMIIILTLNLSFAVNFKSVREWWFDANTYRVQNYLLNYLAKHPGEKKVNLNTNWIFNPSFGFYCITGKTPWLNLTEYHKEIDTASNTLFYYTTSEEATVLKNYTPVCDYPETASVLLQRKAN